jgi:soluble lytic murein transglycosylase-like protein
MGTRELLQSTVRRPLHHRLLLLVAACALAPAVHAQIALRDEGPAGIVLSNAEAQDSGQATVRIAPPRAATARQSNQLATRRSQELAPLVLAAADVHGLPEALLQAVIEVESNYNAGAVSPKGALGLMQLMPQTARQLGVVDPRDPAANIDGGARYLKELLARFGNDLPLALAAYNAGPGAVARSGAIPHYAETQRYVPRVIGRYHSLQSGGSTK